MQNHLTLLTNSKALSLLKDGRVTRGTTSALFLYEVHCSAAGRDGAGTVLVPRLSLNPSRVYSVIQDSSSDKMNHPNAQYAQSPLAQYIFGRKMRLFSEQGMTNATLALGCKLTLS